MASSIASLGGYDCDFVEPPPDGLICLICTFVAKEPMQMNCCGKVYCTACMKEHKKRSNKCPQCSKEGDVFSDCKSKREIDSLQVKCPHGCLWTGRLGSLQDHDENCDFALVPCPKRCKLDTQVLRKDIKVHIARKCPNRDFKCPHCKKEGLHCDITTTHLDTCPMFKVACPNIQCNKKKFCRQNIPNHLKTCPFETVTCKYSNIGCENKLLRKELEGHEKDDQLHRSLCMETILKQEMRQSVSEKQIIQAQTRLGTIESKGTTSKTTFKISKFSQYKESEKEFYSPPFHTHQGGYKMCIWVYANGNGDGKGTHVSVYAYLMRGDNDDSLTWPFTGTVTVELLNQLEDKQHHQLPIVYPEGKDDKYNRRVVDGERAPSGWGRPQFISHEALNHNPATNCQYLKDNCLYFRVSVKTTPTPKPWLTCTV